MIFRPDVLAAGAVSLLLAGSLLTTGDALVLPTSEAPADARLPPLTSILDPGVAMDSIWDDGRAEVSIYEAVEVRYAKPRPTRVVQVLVKEDHVPGTWVKADDASRAGLVPVLKFNWIFKVPTGVYSYEQMLSAFLRRSDLRLVRADLSGHEWCGNTWKDLLPAEGSARLEYRTYWEGEAAGERRIDWGEDTLAWDALPVVLRAVPPARAGRFAARVFPTLIGNRVGAATPESVVVQVTPDAPLPEDDRIARATRIEVGSPAGTDRYWFEAALPRRLLRLETAQGARHRLIASRRLAYWQLNAPGDEATVDGMPPFDPPLARAASR